MSFLTRIDWGYGESYFKMAAVEPPGDQVDKPANVLARQRILGIFQVSDDVSTDGNLLLCVSCVQQRDEFVDARHV